MSSPLEDVFAEVREAASVPLEPVHVRVLEQVEGVPAWVFAVWSDPGDNAALHRVIKARIEAAFLAELSRDVKSLAEGELPVAELRLAVFPDIDVEAAVRAFAFARVDSAAPEWSSAFALLRSEAQRVGAKVADEPASIWATKVDRRAELEELEKALRVALKPLGDRARWGHEPGALFAALLRAMDVDENDPTRAFELVEDAVVSPREGVVRAIPPLVFQALTDGVGVFASRALGAKVAWGASEPDEHGFFPPPVFQLADESILPIGLEALRWCVMPLASGEAPPRFSAWLRSVL